MELRFEKMSVPILKDAVREVKHTELTQEVKLTDGMPDIGRIVHCCGQLLLRSKEWNRDKINVSAGVKVYCLYMPEDGTELRSIETWIPFQLGWDAEMDLPEGQVRIVPLLRFVDGRCVSSRKLMLRVGISALCHGFSPAELELPGVGELPGDIQLLTRTYPVLLPREAGEKAFALDEELAIPESEPLMEKILCCILRPEIGDKKIMGSRLVFKGSGNLRVLYRCPDGNVRLRDFEIPFSQFTEIEHSFGNDARCDILTSVTNLETDLMSPGQIRLKAGLVAQYRIDDRENLEIPEDAYSPFREIKPEVREVPVPSVLDNRRESVAVRQIAAGNTGGAVDAVFLPDFPKMRRTGGSIELEMPGMFQALVQGEDGGLQGISARWEGNLRLDVDENTDLEAIPISVSTVVAEASGDQTEMNAKMEIQLRTTAKNPIPCVWAMEIGEMKEPDPQRPALILRRAGEEELWYLAKAAGSTLAAIREANGFEGEPEPGKMLLIPVA